MTAFEYRESTSQNHTREAHQELRHGAHGERHGPNFNRRELLGHLPESCVYRHVRSAHDAEQTQSLHFSNPYENLHHDAARIDMVSRSETTRHRLLDQAEQNIERHLRHNDRNFAPVFAELSSLRHRDGANIEQDLKHLNHAMHSRGLLRGQEIVRDDRSDGPGWGVVAEDKQNKEHDGHRNGTMVSTSHSPHESAELRRHYEEMTRRGHHQNHHGHREHNGWQQSVEGGGGAHGGYDGQAVGGHVPPGDRRDMIEEALRLAGVPVTEQNISAVNTIVTRESSWNPNSTNNWDSNARAGHPSTGLMQTIPSTFRQYALPGMNNNIHDPLSNLVAGIRYAESRYGGHGESGVARVASRPGGY
ncbi:MAG: transglycosylase SLT domain-containing protein [Cyanobacteria bacterium SZAS LIN-5]|nr:transglycosylase SLT domain-containing protein [Cyanobacteria bacterium SZAS LIN-5]